MTSARDCSHTKMTKLVRPVVEALSLMFRKPRRTVGVGVPYSICVAAFGGTAPYLQQWLKDVGMAQAFNLYAVVLLVISIAFVFSIPETNGKDLRR